ncbi:TetR family transcriptional regulator [Chenggangzhangella methanolivorans]|uniref:TetR family transcriptional regulator n=1 Tax=Chenggangzhangella methanolivorans TaxID=1437009 RepID=UPI0021BDC16B|nr:TetR family transcriptional regulator [Chenggangzhangella methanolivorans]
MTKRRRIAATPVDETKTSDTSRRQRRVLARKSAILDAALTLFSQSGLHGVSAEQIAEPRTSRRPTCSTISPRRTRSMSGF